MKNFMSFGDAETLFTKIGLLFGKRPSTFTGTKAEWEALTDEVKAQYVIVNITDDDDFVGNIVDELIKGCRSAVTSNAVALAIENFITKSVDDLENYYVKDDVDAKVAARLAVQAGAGFHNSIFRGKYLGNEVTADQYDAIAAGTFDDLYIGDYWTIGGVNYRIADFDYWYNAGDTACDKHHVVIVPDANIGSNQQMNDTNVTTGGYIGSKMYTTNIATVRSTIKSAFGNAHILVHRELFTNTVTNGIPTAGAWVDSDIDLMNEPMVYGSYIFAPAPNGSTIPYLYTIDKSQLNLFKHRPDLITTRQHYWLRDVVSSASFACVDYDGYADHYYSSRPGIGVRPAFGLVKE
ncbi:MAG: hypothetical protein K6E34_15135 [Lachnospiraceae bacterium]|nr:hypothetical protein [Lachnospiraceae bacterium]